MTIQLLAGDALDVLPTLAADSVHMVCTSPPYYALRSYLDAAHPDKHREIGSESSPDEYLATMVAVFREVRRVLRPDGTCWVNMGDSYASGEVGRHDHKQAAGLCPSGSPLPHETAATVGRRNIGNGMGAREQRALSTGLPAKNLLLMPARLALALQSDGWWVRSDIIWHKPNPMPESCTDRPTNSYEHVFLLTKSARYFYDADAVREQHQDHNVVNGVYTNPRAIHPDPDNVPPNQGWTGANGFATKHRDYNPAGRNLRNVWTIATSQFSAAHFATFPPELAERCIRAGTSERGCCAACGKPWVREPRPGLGRGAYNDHSMDAVAGMGAPSPNKLNGSQLAAARAAASPATTGWQPGCKCYDVPPELSERYIEAPKVVPCTVLDPFAGAGTTLLVADRLQRDAIGIELNVDYTRMAMDRCVADAPLFTSFPPAEPPEDERIGDLFAEAAE